MKIGSNPEGEFYHFKIMIFQIFYSEDVLLYSKTKKKLIFCLSIYSKGRVILSADSLPKCLEQLVQGQIEGQSSALSPGLPDAWWLSSPAASQGVRASYFTSKWVCPRCLLINAPNFQWLFLRHTVIILSTFLKLLAEVLINYYHSKIIVYNFIFLLCEMSGSVLSLLC